MISSVEFIWDGFKRVPSRLKLAKQLDSCGVSTKITPKIFAEGLSMLNGEGDRVFLPVWRGGRILFFTNFVAKNATRISYIAAAASAPQKAEVMRTGKAPINAEELKLCQSMATDGPKLQKYFAALGGGNLDHFIESTKSENLPYTGKTNGLIYTCLYLDFLRKYAVDEEIIRLYKNSPVEKRFSLDRSVGIYKVLSARLQGELAEVLLDEDLSYNKRLNGPPVSVANLLRECAIIKFDLGKFAEAETHMRQAVKLHDTEDKWRRLGDFATAAGNRKAAIAYFLKANEQNPLPPQSALVLAQAMVDEGQMDKALPFAEHAATVFVKPAAELIKKIQAKPAG